MNISVLGRRDLEKVLEMPSVIEGVKSVYKLKAQGKTVVWPLVSYDFMELPIKSAVIKEADITGEIGQLLCGQIPGRENDDEITIFDATGLALLDLVTGKRAIDLAKAKSLGIEADI